MNEKHVCRWCGDVIEWLDTWGGHWCGENSHVCSANTTGSGHAVGAVVND